jgi:hypothetical protein
LSQIRQIQQHIISLLSNIRVAYSRILFFNKYYLTFMLPSHPPAATRRMSAFARADIGETRSQAARCSLSIRKIGIADSRYGTPEQVVLQFYIRTTARRSFAIAKRKQRLD